MDVRLLTNGSFGISNRAFFCIFLKLSFCQSACDDMCRYFIGDMVVCLCFDSEILVVLFGSIEVDVMQVVQTHVVSQF